MLYNLLKLISKGMMRVYFGRVHIRGLEKVPHDKPLILAANHQSAFTEPVLLGGIMPFPVHFITRGDVFVKRFMWFFKATNQIPIFRFHDGYKRMKQNLDSFAHVYDALGKGARVIIFCEGHMKWEKKLHPLQLGATRMAYGAYEQDPDLDVHIVPIGINYEDHLTMRRYVKISFADPIRLKDFIDEKDNNKRQTLVNTTKELAKRLQPEVIHIPSDDHYEASNHLLQMIDNEPNRRFWPWIDRRSAPIQYSIDAASATKALDDDGGMRDQLGQYVKAISGDTTYTDYVVRHADQFNLLTAFTHYVVLMPMAMIGILIHGLPLWLAARITDSRTTIPEFVGSVRACLGAVLHLIYMILLFPTLFVILGMKAWPALILFFTSGLVALYYWDQKGYWRAWRQSAKDHRTSLVGLRQDIVSKHV